MVSISSNNIGENLTAGMINFSLSCDVSGTDDIMPDIKYLWWHYNGSDTKMIDINSSILSFSSLKLSDAGEYMCQVNISSSLLGSDLTILSIPPHTVRVFGKLIDINS